VLFFAAERPGQRPQRGNLRDLDRVSRLTPPGLQHPFVPVEEMRDRVGTNLRLGPVLPGGNLKDDSIQKPGETIEQV